MRKDWEDLAASFRDANVSPDNTEVDATRAAQLRDGRAARRALLQELADFGKAVGLEVLHEEGETVSWERDGRTVQFEAKGLGDKVRVAFRAWTPREGQLYRESLLDNRWVMSVTHGIHTDKVPLFSAGLERLLSEGLRMNAPTAGGSVGLDLGSRRLDGAVELTDVVESVGADEDADSPSAKPKRHL